MNESRPSKRRYLPKNAVGRVDRDDGRERDPAEEREDEPVDLRAPDLAAADAACPSDHAAERDERAARA